MLGIYTKVYNKWLPCAIGWQSWNQDIEKGEYQVLLWIIVFNRSMGKFKYLTPYASMKWTKNSIFVFCDASSIMNVIQKLTINYSLISIGI